MMSGPDGATGGATRGTACGGELLFASPARCFGGREFAGGGDIGADVGGVAVES